MTHSLRPSLPPMPRRLRLLPVDERGYPVPFFVATVNGKPDHRVSDPAKVALAHHNRLCLTCGQTLGVNLVFVAGPMCGINRISSEPPHHLECAEWAVQACPFLSRPHARRRTAGLPDEIAPAAGVPLERNPGVTMLWVTKHYQVVPAPGGIGALFEMGDPSAVHFYAEGRRATRAELDESIRTGIPLLADMATREGAEAEQALLQAYRRFLTLIPKDMP